VHLRDWKQASKETVATGTKSALAGGVTTVAEMPNTDPRNGSAEMVSKRIELLQKESYTDFAVHAGVPEEAREVRMLRNAGAFAVKFYPHDLARIRELARPIRDLGLMSVVHAEDPTLIDTADEEEAEPRAVHKVLEDLGEYANMRFAHISTSSAVAAIISRKPSNLTIEVAPHHLFMTREVAKSRIGRAYIVRPPLRSATNCRKMLGFLQKGLLDFYATDHAPHTKNQKYSPKPAPGFPGLEIAFPLMLTKTNDIALTCRVFCENPARYLGIQKGRIAAGYFADLVVMRKRNWTIDPGKFISKGRITPFQGEQLHFSVVRVLKGGEVAFDGGELKKAPARLVTETKSR
jgi:dihydroorotase